MSYKIRRLECTANDIEESSRFLSSSFSLSSNFTNSEKVSSRYLQWQYVDNPLGSFIGYGAFFNNKMVSHFATLPVKYRIDGIERMGLLALNLVTDPEHRGKGLFVEIAKRTLSDARDEGYYFAVGVANQNSSYGLINKLGFSFVAQLDIMVGMGTVMPDYNGQYRLSPMWDRRSLEWRFSNPSSKPVQSGGDSVVTSTGRFNVYAQLTAREEIQSLEGIPKSRFIPLKVWIGLSNRVRRKGVFIPLPSKLRPVPLNFIFKSLQGTDEVFVKDDILFELIDFDAY